MNYADIIVPGNRPNEVSIRFIVQNLKNQLVHVNRLKSYFRHNLIFQADIFEQLWQRPSYEVTKQNNSMINEKVDINKDKAIFFETDETEKTILRNKFKGLLLTFNLKSFV